MTAHTRIVLTGDFESNYAFERTTRFDPPRGEVREEKQRTSIRWIGPCEPGMIGGDVKLKSDRSSNK